MAQTTWNIDPTHSGIHFSVRHMVVSKVRGRFASWNGELSFDPSDLTSAKVDVRIDANSIDTGVKDRDVHLRSADFLDVEQHPELRYRGERVEKLGEREYRVHGELTIAGVTRPVALEVEFAGRAQDPWGNERALFEAKTQIDRKDFGLKWNQMLEAGGVLVGDKVEIQIELQAVNAAAKAA